MLSKMAGQHPAQTTFNPASPSSAAWTPSLGCISPQTPMPLRHAIALGSGGSAAEPPTVPTLPAVPSEAAPPAEQPSETAVEPVQEEFPEGRDAHPIV